MPIIRDGRNRVDVYSVGPAGVVPGPVMRSHAVLPVRFHHDAGLSRGPRARRVYGPGERRKSMVAIAARDARAQRVVAALSHYDRTDPMRFELVADELGMKVNAVAIVAKHAAIRNGGARA